MSVTKETFTSGAWGHCADIPVSPEEDAQICASARPAFVGPIQQVPERRDAPKLNSRSFPPKSYSY